MLIYSCVADEMSSQYLGCDAVHSAVLGHWTGWNPGRSFGHFLGKHNDLDHSRLNVGREQ